MMSNFILFLNSGGKGEPSLFTVTIMTSSTPGWVGFDQTTVVPRNIIYSSHSFESEEEITFWLTAELHQSLDRSLPSKYQPSDHKHCTRTDISKLVSRCAQSSLTLMPKMKILQFVFTKNKLTWCVPWMPLGPAHFHDVQGKIGHQSYQNKWVRGSDACC